MLLLANCVIYEEDVESKADTGGGELLFRDKTPITIAVPEHEGDYTADGLRFNWAVSSIPFFEVFISSEELTSDKEKVQNPEKILAFWNSSLNIPETSSLGFLEVRAFQKAENGDIMGSAAPQRMQSIQISPGVYYWSVIGFDPFGNLEYSSVQNRFVIIP